MNRAPPRHPLLWSLLILLGGLLLAWRAEVWQVEQQQRLAEARFHDLAQRATEQLGRRMRIYEYGLRGLRGTLITMGEYGISRSRIINYSESREYDMEFPGSRGYGFIRRVPVAEESAFLKRARRDGKPDFKIRQLAPHDHERLIIQYIEPEERNREAVGLDIASEASRRKAALQAIRTGETILTHPITLVQASGKVKRAFLLMTPTYRSGRTPVTEGGRERSAFGLAYTPLVIDEILADFDFRNGEFSLTLYDRKEDGQLDAFFEPEFPAAAAGGLIVRHPLAVFGRQWFVDVKALPPFIASLNPPRAGQTALTIVAGSLALAGLVYGLLLVQARKREVMRGKARLAAIVEGAHDAIVGLGLDGTITDWNPAAETIFGFPASAAVGHKTVDLIVPADRRDEELRLIAMLRAGEPVRNIATRRCGADGHELDVALTLSPIRGEGNEIIGMSKTLRDIGEEMAARRRIEELNDALEQKVAERTAHLEAAVQELAEFSYLASHDLRTPLRAIDGFSQLLLREQGADGDGAERLDRIRKAAQKMGRIIDDMVSLTQLARTVVVPQQVDLSALVEEELARLRRQEPQRRIEAAVEPGLCVQADDGMIRLLLAQLIGNAWKFTRDIPEARIEVGAGGTAVDGMLKCFVRDNGIGFDMTHAGRIFMPFQRLHSGDNYPGSGIGLAQAQRIVRKHGGDLRADATPGGGATFTFTLPIGRESP